MKFYLSKITSKSFLCLKADSIVLFVPLLTPFQKHITFSESTTISLFLIGPAALPNISHSGLYILYFSKQRLAYSSALWSTPSAPPIIKVSSPVKFSHNHLSTSSNLLKSLLPEIVIFIYYPLTVQIDHTRNGLCIHLYTV